MNRFLFILSGDDRADVILPAFAREHAGERFDVVLFDNGTTTGAAPYALAHAHDFGAVHTIAKRVERALSNSEAAAVARAFAAEHFPAVDVVLVGEVNKQTNPAAVRNAAEELTTWKNPASPADTSRPTSIESFCTVATENFLAEVVLLIRSIRARNNQPIYVAGDDAVCRELRRRRDTTRGFSNVFPFRIASQARLEWLQQSHFEAQRAKDWPRNDYPHCPPACLVKMDIAQRALELSSNTLFLDADFVVVGSMGESIAPNIDCAFTPSWHSPRWKGAAETFGRYNAGNVFVRNPAFPDWWRQAALHRSRFMDQQCLDLAEKEGFTTADLSPSHNFGFWRLWHEVVDLKNTKLNGEELADLLGFTQGPAGILLNGEPLISFHVQMFHDTPGHAPLRRLVRYLLENSRNPLQAGLCLDLRKANP